MRVVIIGGTGHVGTYLVPRLVQAGYEVISVSRQQRLPYQSHSAWDSVEQVRIDRVAAEEAGSFGEQIEHSHFDALSPQSLGHRPAQNATGSGDNRHLISQRRVFVSRRHSHDIQRASMS